MISLTGSLLVDPSIPREDVSSHVAQVAGDVDMVEPSITAQKRKEKKEKRKSGVVAEQKPAHVAQVNVADEAHAEKETLRREKKAAKRLAQQAAVVAGGLAHDITDTKIDEAPTSQPAAIPTGGLEDVSSKKHKKRKADLGEAGGEHKKRKKDTAGL